ncbi:MAG: amino acid ABC transporter permease [Lactobacillaceae bacterium]|jgi:putative glutamine transport system permease protein|nr:amino acid ABC transporter permease [Lactobacillaceae bacterium]
MSIAMTLASTIEAFNYYNLRYLFIGLLYTLSVSVISIALSFVFGSIFGIIVYEKIPYFSRWVSIAVDIVRNLPLLLIIFFMYFALPNIGVHLSIFWASIAAFTFFESAMVSEIVRGGIMAVDKGQFEGARANGLTNAQTMFRIVLPQAYKKIVPPLVSQFISLVKDTSLATGIVLPELMYRGQIIYGQNSNYMIPVFIMLAIIYFVVNFGLSLISKRIEKNLA